MSTNECYTLSNVTNANKDYFYQTHGNEFTEWGMNAKISDFQVTNHLDKQTIESLIAGANT